MTIETRRLYDPAMYRFATPIESYWRASAGPAPAPLAQPDGGVEAEIAVIGGGYAGLIAALKLAEAGRDVALFEAGAEAGWGASGRNGGFVSGGGTKLGLGGLQSRVGEDGVRDYLRSQVEAVGQVAELIETHAIDCDRVGEALYCVAHSPASAAAMRAETKLRAERFGQDVRFLEAETFRAQIHDGTEAFGGMREAPGFGLHPLKYVRGLARAASTAGARLFGGSEVVGWRREAGRHRLTLAGGRSATAKKLILAMNGYAPDGLHPSLDRRALPAISGIVVTQPYSDAEWSARGFHDQAPVYNARRLLYYYRRLPGGRLLFGGRGDVTGGEGEAARRAEALLEALKHVLPAFADARAEHSWRGLVALTRSRSLALGALPDDPTVSYAYGCHGSGVATMSWAGAQMARLAMEDDPSRIEIPALFHAPPRLPALRALRRLGLRGAYAWYGMSDRLGL